MSAAEAVEAAATPQAASAAQKNLKLRQKFDLVM
jgi:hypothetical protein